MPIRGRKISVPDVSLHEFIWERLVKHGDHIALIDSSRNGASLTYRQIFESSKKCASYLQSIGIEKDDVVCICSPNCLEYSILLLGILGSGATISTCYYAYKGDEMACRIMRCRPKVIFVHQIVIDRIKSILGATIEQQTILVIGNSTEYTTLDEILSETKVDSLRHVEIDSSEHIAALPLTSGTTGIPKAVAMTHRNYMSVLGTASFKERDPFACWYIDRPMNYSGGFITVLSNLINGNKLVFEDCFHVEKMLAAMEKYKVTTVFSTPNVGIELVNINGFEKYDLSSFKTLILTGSTMPPNVAERLILRYKIIVVPVYGMTECPSIAMGVFPDQDLSSSGKVSEGMELKIVDSVTRKECPVGQSGEILIRGPKMMKGYFENEEANAQAFDNDGWFKSGDVGYLNHDGSLFIIDRLKELLKFNGLSISPSELESVILRHPKVADVGIVGVPDELHGEIPRALVVRSDHSLTESELIEIVAENLAEYKNLRGGVQFIDQIPKSMTGKIMREKLKKMS